MGGIRALFAALVVAIASPILAQEASEAPADGTEVALVTADGQPDYAAWEETASRAEVLSEAGRGSAFALTRLREEIVGWRDVFAAARAANAARIATVQAQIDSLGAVPGEDAPTEDPRVASRRAGLEEQLARLRAPGLLAQEAYVHADGLIGEIDSLTRSRQAAALLSRSASPLDPRLWPELTDAVGTRLLGLWKEVTTSVRSEPRREVFGRNWPIALALLSIGAMLLTRGRSWLTRLGTRATANRTKGRFRGAHAANVIRLALSVAEALIPLLGFTALTAGVETTGLFGTRASALLQSVPLAAACVLGTSWLAGRFLSTERNNPPPFDFPPEVKQSAAGRLRQSGWILAAALLARGFLAVGDIAPEVRAALMLPIYVLLSVVVFRFGRCLAAAGRPRDSDDDSILFRRRLVIYVGRAISGVAAASPVLMILGFHRAGSALLLPSVITLGLLGVLIVLQWFATDLYALLLRREDGIRDALLPVLVGFALFLLALPILALIWGARPEDLAEAWTRFLGGISVGETQLSPKQFAMFGLVFGLGWALTRLVQGTLRSTVLPKTQFDAGAQNAIVAGLGYLGLTLAALLAFTIAGLDLSNLAIVAGALSVGIGFGLQNIVQNFVSGIILLIERPISEGDWIEVGPRMGYVRDISVRSTRIETFDRTDVIVPNADLVSGQVVNWTRGNLVGRIIMPVSVAYGNDVDHVTRLLRDIAEAHPMVLLSPPPAVVLAGFGADVLNFEIRAIIRDVNFGTTTRSEINQEIAKRFLAEHIHTAAPPALPAPPPKPAA
ncbi:Potassium efflux system KefA protein / Small-conductance mechanosensitive channel [Rubellimicrobium mesophilum DSM 19309]|uniref:Potassium efflux system KefA protein / Small-conductance mechanosensitive channel n=1 Tax=Rubellimicrobium mesophilum DSM 19309 TaxID=442562 RepID=A0A017HMW8_9RHOB|nr:DUF3772 domain-containing protein [Rubellimicrobium mesophilum]EYD75837.1 Potassium efflux system KefA protein / Small-conductance mechanosensitive channel [Rubellimicrobium mesophilum DSM 19309]